MMNNLKYNKRDDMFGSVCITLPNMTDQLLL